VKIRPASPEDLPVIREMLFYAARWRSGEGPEDGDAVLADDRVARYADDWGRPGDLGVVAEHAAGAVGAAWVRLFPRDRPGYGFIDDETPELSIAVVPDQRGAGIGSALLSDLFKAIADAGYRAISLSVEPDNPARRLYQRLGFRKVAGVGGSWTMRLDL
jgi:ribosomal protein S18 acetylase RimI-like enzyme